MPEAEVKPADWTTLVPPIFARCVDPYACRHGLSMPFVQGRWLYATDGRICVRMPAPEPWPFEPAGRIPKDLDGNIFRTLACQPEGVEFPMPEGDCSTCNGSKHLEVRPCPDCEGEGSIECDCDRPHCDNTYECEDCKGSGSLGPGPCLDCDGTGIKDALDSIELAPQCLIRRSYSALLRQAQAVAFPPVARPAREGIRFTIGDDIEGVLMPVSL